MAGSTREQARDLQGDSGSIARGILDRLKRVNPERFRRRGGILYERARKWLRRRSTTHPTRARFPVFIFGSNRSGTQMVCKAIGNSPQGWDYPETNFVAFNEYTLRSEDLIERLIQRAPAPIVTFGCILDSQFGDELLSRFEGARAIWVYRRYQDAANSSASTWGAAGEVKNWVRWVANGEVEKLGAQGKRVSAETVELLGELFHDDLSVEESACLYWYMRNQIYFELELDRDPRVLIVQYEDAVLDAEKGFRRIFGYLGFAYHPQITQDVFAGSVGKREWPGMDPRIQSLCDALTARLDECYRRDTQPQQQAPAS